MTLTVRKKQSKRDRQGSNCNSDSYKCVTSDKLINMKKCPSPQFAMNILP